MRPQPTPRSVAIVKSWKTLDVSSVFAAILYPALGVIGLGLAFTLGLALDSLTLAWWYAPLAVCVGAFTLIICNMGIGVLHRVWHHKAGQLTGPAQAITALTA